MNSLAPLLEKKFLTIPLESWLLAGGILIGSWVAKKIIGYVYERLLHSVTAKTKNEYDELIVTCLRKPAEFLVFIGGLYIALDTLQLPAEPVDLQTLSTAAIRVLVTLTITWALFNLVSVLDRTMRNWADRSDSNLDDNLVRLVRKCLRGLIIVLAILMAIQNLGYSIAGLLASLGIGGIAVAMAARDSIANIFGSLMILFDRPFKVGDWILAGDIEGTVEEIGFRSTRIRTFAKTLITVPNNGIANMPIDNFSRMPKRRIKLTVGVTYDTTPGQMSDLVQNIRDLLNNHPDIDQEFHLVNFTDFGSSSLDIMVYCFAATTAWGDYLATRQDLCLRIMQILEEMDLEIAFPSRTVYLQNEEPAMEG